jgi:hypothetical protein
MTQTQSAKRHPNNPANQPFNLPASSIRKTNKMLKAIAMNKNVTEATSKNKKMKGDTNK